jgi:hypothetical protein
MRDIAERNVAGFAPGESSRQEPATKKPRCQLLTARPFGVAQTYFAIMAFCDFM